MQALHMDTCVEVRCALALVLDYARNGVATAEDPAKGSGVAPKLILARIRRTTRITPRTQRTHADAQESREHKPNISVKCVYNAHTILGEQRSTNVVVRYVDFDIPMIP